MAVPNPNAPAGLTTAERPQVIKTVGAGTPYGENAPISPSGINWPSWK